ncbi:MAG TPA: alanine--tRNA ligase [Candidatus Desulfofervidus auxilii]|uniref:Alanine--tRNA ligase n=1 Tax=Desulfofervidus auxilii TaxID=1621989 RepID=A0A7V0NEZ0_DESA2|nr:alanine--tRNA ligase [Candidatus Desulfofervidus auxilii]
MLSLEIRRCFLEYFKRQGHMIIPSSSLIPAGDPTLLFTNAGMVQFKRVFLGEEKRSYTRAASCQKCLRAGGKHNDLENVGLTIRHHTFFEMLGNFSFGDYFKEEAIFYAWELLTKEFGLPKNHLWVTVFKEDDEAYEIWHKKIGVAKDRIVRLGEKDNFWTMGETGPCGPCSEIVIDLGDKYSCGRPDCKVGCDCDRYLELWNLVFMQYNRDSEGKLTPLPHPCIDTGMGLERIAMILQKVHSNYETDLFVPIIEALSELSGIKYQRHKKETVSFHVIADHVRAIAFVIADGILPSNEGRGYVLRRIIRRSVRHGRLLGLKEPFLYRLTEVVVNIMGNVYPELKESFLLIKEITQREEERFIETLDYGLKLLTEEIEKIKERKESIIKGEIAFKLYDTYGFPIDIINDIAREEKLLVDMKGFEKAMFLQRQQARRTQKIAKGILSGADIYATLTYKGEETEFVGYSMLETNSKVIHLIKKGKEVTILKAGEKGELIAEKTPFYAERGGQVGDTGVIVWENGKADVLDTQHAGNLIVHLIEVKEGVLSNKEEITLKVNAERRKAIACNHTATHLLQAALRKILGVHVRQAGSLVAPERLRFDFTHYAALDSKLLEDIEMLVNKAIQENQSVEIKQMPMLEAIKSGAIAIFEEKYADIVRVVSISNWSKELCGGTHVNRTGDIGFFKIISESSVAAGVRRIEALTAENAVRYIQEKERLWAKMSYMLKAKPDDVLSKIEKILQELKYYEKETERLRQLLATRQAEELLRKTKQINGIAVLATEVPWMDAKNLRDMGDKLKNRLKSGIIVLGTRSDEKVVLLAMVTKDLINKIKANEILKQIAPLIGGGGGGKPDMAQAGGKYPDKLPQALAAVYALIERMK